MATKVEIPQLALDLVSTALMAGLMNSGYDFRVEIPLVVSVDKIPLIVSVATFVSLYGSLSSTTKISELFNTSTSSKESFLSSTPSLELLMSSTCSSDWILHPLKFSTISAKTPAAIHLSSDQLASFFCTLLVPGD